MFCNLIGGFGIDGHSYVLLFGFIESMSLEIYSPSEVVILEMNIIFKNWRHIFSCSIVVRLVSMDVMTSISVLSFIDCHTALIKLR